ncbi:hypothetical protein D3C86_2215280 [compost metagenome]
MSIAQGDWAMAGFDLTCLGSGLFLSWATWRMWRSGQANGVVPTHTARARRTTLEQEMN